MGMSVVLRGVEYPPARVGSSEAEAINIWFLEDDYVPFCGL